MEENNVKITGKIVEEPTYLLTARGGRKIYTSVIEIMRTSGVLDVIPIQVPEELAGEIWDHVGGRITLFGEYRSYNEKDGERNHLKLYVFVKGISEAGEADLEDGMVVEQRDGNMYLVLAGKAVRKGRCNHIDGYTDDLKWEGYTGGDIVKVYRITPESLGCIEDVFIKSNLELIWERTETKKMTIEEMRQKLEELTGEEIEVTA